MSREYEITIIEEINQGLRTFKAQPLELGGITGSGGGLGGPPGGFIGMLPQSRVAYDLSENETLYTPPTDLFPPSGASLVDNLNHIRYRLGVVESGIQTVGGGSDLNSELLTLYFDFREEPYFSDSGSGVLVRQDTDDKGSTWYYSSIPVATGNDQPIAYLVSEGEYLSEYMFNNIFANISIQQSYPPSDRTISIYAKFYTAWSDGTTKTLIGTTETVTINQITGITSLEFPLTSRYYLGLTSQFIVEIYANISDGSATEASLYVYGKTSHILLNTNRTSTLYSPLPPTDGIPIKYYLTTEDSDITDYKLLSSAPQEDSTLSKSLVADDYLEAFSFITPVGEPNQIYKLPGMYHTRIWMKKGTITHTVWGGVELYSRTTGGTETLINYSDWFDIVDTNWKLFNLYMPVEVFNELTADGTDRYVLKVIVNAYDDGSDGTILIRIDNTSGVEIQAESSLLFNIVPPRVDRYVQMTVINYLDDITTGDGKGYIVIPDSMDGMNLVYAHAKVITAGTTGTTDIQIANVTGAVDMLSTKLTIDSGETGSETGTPYVINTSNDNVSEYDLLRIDVDAISTTPPKGLIVTLGFAKP